MSFKFMTDNEFFNIKLVKTVEKYPSLYDTTTLEYNSKDVQDIDWAAVGNECGAKDCKVKFKHLRAGLTRYIKQMQSGRKVKQFYLWNEMQFLVPFLKSKTQPLHKSISAVNEGGPHFNDFSLGKVEDPLYVNKHSSIRVETSPYVNQPDSVEVEDPLDNDRSVNDGDKSLDVDSYSGIFKEDTETMSSCENVQSCSSYMDSSIRGRKRQLNDSYERVLPDHSTRTCGEESLNPDHNVERSWEESLKPDLEFFKSILPDVAVLNASQKRRFKIKVLQFIEDLNNEDLISTEEFPIKMEAAID